MSLLKVIFLKKIFYARISFQMKTIILKRLRDKLKISQKEMAAILGVSVKSIQSYEQGWRKLPQYIEKMVLLLTSSLSSKKQKNCWIIKKCRPEIRSKCVVYRAKLGHCCWAVTGSICYNNRPYRSWAEKKQACITCSVLKNHFKDIF